MIDLNNEQKKAVENYGNVLVSAPPGSGKTRTLIARAKYKLNQIPQKKSLALITYTNAAADEMSSRIDSDNDGKLYIGTIHRFCLEFILRPFSWIYDWDKPKVISFDEKKDFLNGLKKCGIKLGIDELNTIKKDLSGKLDLTVDWNSEHSIKDVAKDYYNYLSRKKMIDFNEILYRSYKIISENDFVCRSLSNKFYEILIDEFQDTNHFQYKIFELINVKKNCTFFMVGDLNQAIMRFAGAMDIKFSNVKKDFNLTIVQLIKAYRSTTNIVDTYSSLFDNHPTIENCSDYKDLNYDVDMFNCSDVCVRCFHDCTNNIDIIIEIIDKLFQLGIEESNIAILSPWWTDCIKLSKHLRNSYNLVGLGALPHKTKDIRSTTSFNLIKSLSRFYKKSSIRNLRIIKKNIELHMLENNISFDSETKMNKITNRLLSDFLINEDEYLITGLENVKLSFDKYFNFSHNTINEIIKRLDEKNAEQWTFKKYLNVLSGVGGIINQTVHASKGLEFDAVILNRIDEGRVPYGFPPGTENIKDGKNLFYVGLSRPKKYLAIIHNSNKSRFIDIISS